MTQFDYDMVIIGGGTGGLVTASGLAQLGAEVCLIEKEDGMLGGDCLYYGCVPSKTLINSAGLAQKMREADKYGLPAHDPEIDFSKVMDRMWNVIDHIEEHDNAERFREMGVDVRFGDGRFTSPHEFELNGETISGRRFTIATGSSPAVPPIEGIDSVDYMTNVEALRLDELPDSMIVVGGGPIGLELGQTFHRFGCDVHVIETLPCILPKEDEEIACEAHELLENDGLNITTEVRANAVREEDGQVVVNAEKNDKEETLRAETLLMATGRRPNVEGLNLEAAGVEYDEESGINVNPTMQTSQGHINAVGDVTGKYPFTHVAEYQAGIVIGNIISAPIPFYSRKADYSVVPWCTFTDPEVARVGMTEDEAIEQFGESNVRVDRFPFTDQDRALIEGKNQGLIKLVYRQTLFGVELKGAHIVGPSAGELIHEYVLAMNNGIKPSGISGTIHVYPTLSQSVKRATDEYFSDVLFSGWIPWIAQKYLSWTR
jgi:pyruvate/2-oxoglutarate dehydrogenase complex dihydrolipoamide dehydrogenase (E3) component